MIGFYNAIQTPNVYYGASFSFCYAVNDDISIYDKDRATVSNGLYYLGYFSLFVEVVVCFV